MVKEHPYRSVAAVLAAMAVCLFVGGMIGQYNDGPWGGLPEWLGATMWFGFLALALVLVALSAYLVAANLRWRRTHSAHHPHTP
jgi:high-affinity Fe2+/Pb2+ permease